MDSKMNPNIEVKYKKNFIHAASADLSHRQFKAIVMC